MRSQRQNLLRTVSEAALFLDGDLSAWLQRVADAIAVDLDRGYGAQVVLFDPSRPKTPALAGATTGGPPGLLQYVLTINERSPDWELARITPARVSQLCTFRELAGGSATQNFFEDKPLDGIVIKDWVALMLPLGMNRLLMAGGFTTNEARLKNQQRQNWNELVPLLSTGLSLQLSAAAARSDEKHSDKHHRSPPGVSTSCVSARRHLQEVAQKADRAQAVRSFDAPTESNLSSTVVDGSWMLVDRFEADGRRLNVAVPNPTRNPTATLTPRQRQVAKLAAEGLSNKEIGYRLGVEESTIGSLIANVLHLLKMRRREELVTALHVPHRSTVVTCGALPVRVMSCPALPTGAIQGLTSSESDVALRAASGVSTRTIAAARGVSSRTVVNQLSSVFRKLSVASRSELASLLAGQQKST